MRLLSVLIDTYLNLLSHCYLLSVVLIDTYWSLLSHCYLLSIVLIDTYWYLHLYTNCE